MHLLPALPGLLFLLAGAAPQPAAPAGPPVQILRDVPYGEDPVLQSLDVYRPKAKGPHPVLVFIHGGGWSEGDKGRFTRKGTFFARQGFVYVTVNYRLSPAVRHPAHAQDVGRALGFIFRNAARFGGDPHRLVLLGHSAGAHLAALVATDPGYLQRNGVPPQALRAVALLDGSGYDLTTRVPNARGWMRQMLLTAFGEDPLTWADASPVRHLADRARPPPPFLILHVTVRRSSTLQAKALQKALRAAGGEAQVVAVEGRNHVTINRMLGLPDEPVTRRLLAFFRTRARAPL